MATEQINPTHQFNIHDVDGKLRNDIKKFVDSIFTDSQSISPEKKAEFGQLVRLPQARLLFAMFVDEHRVNSQRVSELTFYSLAQYFSIVLFECLLAEDFRPSKIIMNMMFTYYYQPTCDTTPFNANISLSSGTGSGFESDDLHISNANANKIYLYPLLKDQEIFKSIRFWTSAFYDSVINERNNHSVFVDREHGKLSVESRDEESDCSKNISFGLLGSFIHNMSLLDLSYNFCRDFLDKHSTIAGLSDEQLDMLKSNMKSLFSDDPHVKSSQSAGERLSNFLHKLGTRLNHDPNNHHP